jgi:Uncharacterized NAD(FAD)-dependent dehydrogenases
MKYLIIGGVAGGATCAARLRRLDESAEIIILERGPHISYANCGLPYYVGGVIESRKQLLLQSPTSFGNRFNVDVRVEHEAVAINPVKKEVCVRNLRKDSLYTETYDKLLLSPGAVALRPPIAGIDLEGIFSLRTVPDSDAIMEKAVSLLEQERDAPPLAVVVGAGFIGLEMAENLRHLGLDVCVVEAADQVMTPVDPDMAAALAAHLVTQGVDLKLQSRVQSFVQEDDKRLRLCFADGANIVADMVLLSIGVAPETTLAAAAGLQLAPKGGIEVNAYLQTSHEDIYAVGDAVAFPHPLTGQPSLSFLAGPANRQARICAENMALGNQRAYSGSLRTAIAKVFERSVGCAGLSQRDLQHLGWEYKTAIVHAGSHAGYYPGAATLSLKIHFSAQTGQLWGAQAIGAEGVDKRLDLLSEAIRRRACVSDLTELEHAYAPPFSSAKDPVIQLGCVAENILTGRMPALTWDQVLKLPSGSFQFLDVRTLGEFKEGALPGALHIPVEELRERLDDIPQEQRWVIYCGVGLRGYVATRILLQSGYTKVQNLLGGISSVHDIDANR